MRNGLEYVPVKLWRDTVTYVVTVEGCTDSSKQFTQVYPQPRIELGNDTTVCKNEILELSLNSWNSQYLWENGSTLGERRIVKPGLYWVRATNLCGSVADSVKIDYRDFNCRIFVPNAFTPTGDGLNERFGPVGFELDEDSFDTAKQRITWAYTSWYKDSILGTMEEPDPEVCGSPVISNLEHEVKGSILLESV